MLKIRNFIRNNLIYTTWKDNDIYPSLVYNNYWFQSFCDLIGFTTFRVNFWNFIAKRNHPFVGFYSPKVSSLPDKRLRLLYENGYIIENNFLPESLFQKYAKIFDDAVDNFINSNEYKNNEKKQLRTTLNLIEYDLTEFEDEMKKQLRPITEYFYGKIKPIFRYELEISKDGTDYVSALAKWHMDRFIPSLKCQYFPLGVNDAPLSYIKGSHLIDKRFIKNSKFFTKSKNYHASSKKNMMLKDDVFFELCSDEQSNIVEFNNLEPNTLYIGAHQGLHRKKPFERKGFRVNISIEFTHTYSKYKLIYNALKNSFRN